jgi:ubiquinone/menaquinone biosynthesis C-methylase UbiE
MQKNIDNYWKEFFHTLVSRMKSYAHQVRRTLLAETSASYWTRYNVTLHRSFKTAEESLAYFHWRNDQYIDYITLMPVDGQDGKVVLDYGCGPGNDLVGFEIYSNPARLIGVDVSPSSLEQARQRLELHNSTAECFLISEADPALPFDDGSIDYIHSSGVIHHIKEPVRVLSELKRILKSDGEMRIMVYNYNSIFLHLHVAFIARLMKGLYKNVPIRDAFRRFTDGEECPISSVYKPEEFLQLANGAGLHCEFIGASVSVKELADLHLRWQAVMHPGLEEEHRHFLINLQFNERGLPLFNDVIAGHDGCYRLRHK